MHLSSPPFQGLPAHLAKFPGVLGSLAYEGGDGVWCVVHIAPNRAKAEEIQAMLEQEGFLVRVRRVGLAHLGEAAAHAVLLPESEAEEGQGLILSHVARAEALPPQGRSPEEADP